MSAIEQRIEQAIQGKTESLDLSNMKIEKLDSYIGEVTSLKVLQLNNNRLTDLPYSSLESSAPQKVVR